MMTPPSPPDVRTRPPASLRRSDWALRTADYAFVGMLWYLAFPETLMEPDSRRVGVLPIEYLLISTGLACLIAPLLRRLARSYLAWLPFLIVASLTIHGVLRGFETKWVSIDAYASLALIGGFTWAHSRDPARIVLLFRIAAWGCLILAFLTMLGMKMGVVDPVYIDSVRVYTFSQYYAANCLAFMLPFLLYRRPARESLNPSGMSRWALPVCGYACIVIVAISTATRSVLLTGLLSGLISIWAVGRWTPLWRWLSLSLFAAALIALFNAEMTGRLGSIGERLLYTKIRHEQRYDELRLFWKFMEGEEFIGKGFGSRYVTAWDNKEGGLVLGPHIGIFWYFQKGGVLLFLVCVAAPAAWALYHFLIAGLSAPVLGCFSGILIYLGISMISGGTDLPSMLMYGIFLSLAFDARRRHT